MNTHDIELTLRKLRLSGMAETLQTRALQAQAAQEPFMDTLAALLQDEMDRRHSRLMARRVVASLRPVDSRSATKRPIQQPASYSTPSTESVTRLSFRL